MKFENFLSEMHFRRTGQAFVQNLLPEGLWDFKKVNKKF